MPSLSASTPLDNYRQTINGTTVREVNNLFMASIAIPDGGNELLSQQLASIWQLSLPVTSGCVRVSDISFAGSDCALALFGLQADQCLLVCEADSMFSHDPFDHLSELLEDTAYLTDQSDSYAVLDVQGAMMLSAMERVCTLDLSRFTGSSVARTSMEHLSVIVERPTADHVRLYSPRSSAQSFLHAITTSLTLSTEP